MTQEEGIPLDVLGRQVRVNTQAGPEEIKGAVAILEGTFRDMERAYELRWGIPPSALDTSTWLLMGALNLAHRVARLEREACQHTQNLEQTLTKLLDDVPDETIPPSGPLPQGANHPLLDGPEI
ncbi:MAG: cell division protein ZapA [Holophaga sp.]|nr:cell division protein ZapA [Holophaga sp.]